jgi:hypothetical protein
MSLEVYGIFSSTYYWVAMKKGHIAVPLRLSQNYL